MIIFAGIIIVLYTIITLLMGIIVYNLARNDYKSRFDSFFIAIIGMLMGPIITSFCLLFFEDEIKNVPKMINAGMNMLKIEKVALQTNAYIVTANGEKLPLVGEFRKDVGLLINKYVKKELDNRW